MKKKLAWDYIVPVVLPKDLKGIEPGKLQISNWVPITFIGSFLSLVAACVLYLVEILYASNTISFDPVHHAQD